MKRLSDLTNRIVSSSASLIAIIALGTSLYEARLNREQQRAAVWPYVLQSNTGANGHYARVVSNEGVGPALVKSFQIWARPDSLHPYRPMHDLRELIDTLRVDVPPRTPSYSSTVGRGIVIRAGDSREVFTLLDSAVGRAFARRTDDMDTRICYCSLYGDCWKDTAAAPEPVPVDACPSEPALEFFR